MNQNKIQKRSILILSLICLTACLAGCAGKGQPTATENTLLAGGTTSSPAAASGQATAGAKASPAAVETIAPTGTTAPGSTGTPGSSAAPLTGTDPARPTAKPDGQSAAKPTAGANANAQARPTAKPAPQPTAKPAPQPTAKPAPKPTAKPAPVPTQIPDDWWIPTPAPTPIQTTQADADWIASQILNRINAERQAMGRGALSTAPIAHEIACMRAKELAEDFSHYRPDGSCIIDVYTEWQYGLPYAGGWHPGGGENISASGTTCLTKEEAVNSTYLNFKNSVPHWSDISNAKYAGVGIGCYIVQTSEMTIVYTCVLTMDKTYG